MKRESGKKEPAASPAEEARARRADEFRQDVRRLCLVRHHGKLFAGDLPRNVAAFIDDLVEAFERRSG